MAQLSRPYQVALAAIGVLAAVWFVALRGHSGSGGGSSVPAPQPAAPAPKAVSPTPASPTAPGVAGLTRAIEKARGAVKASEHNAKQLQQKSAEASSPSATAAPPASSTGGTRPSPSPTHRSSAPTHTSPGATAHSPGAHATPSHLGAPARQVRVEGELKRGNTVVVLFWNPRGAEDRAVRGQLLGLKAVERIFHAPHSQRYVLEEAGAKEVGSFGTFTRAVQVYQTPTILIILPNGKTTTMTGLVDAYAIAQAISDARRG
jgi:hypothetical protein